MKPKWLSVKEVVKIVIVHVIGNVIHVMGVKLAMQVVKEVAKIINKRFHRFLLLVLFIFVMKKVQVICKTILF